jgi:hypothetical protein
MATVTAFLKHGFISKAKQAQPYTAMAHARYIMRTEATQHVYSERMPKQWHAVQRFLEQHENGLRKNGRVMDKFIISIPHDVSEQDAITTLRRFGNWLGQGRTPFLFSLQGFDTRNHHAHFIFIDRDVETGKRVYGTTEMNSTHGIKLEWERVANSAFEEMGYDVRIAVKDGYQQDADNDNVLTPAPLNTDAAVEPVEPEEDTQPDEDAAPEEEMADIQAIDPVATVRFLHDRVASREYLHRCQSRYTDAKARHEWLVSQRDRLATEASNYDAESLPKLQAAEAIRERFDGLRKENGALKGIDISVFGFNLFKSKTRKLAEAVQAQAAEAHLEARQIEYTRQSYTQKVAQAETQALTAEEAAYHHKAELERLYGTEEEMGEAEELMTYQIRDAAHMVPLEQAQQAYEAGQLTFDEYRTYLVEAGYHAEVQLLDEHHGESEDGGASL